MRDELTRRTEVYEGFRDHGGFANKQMSFCDRGLVMDEVYSADKETAGAQECGEDGKEDARVSSGCLVTFGEQPHSEIPDKDPVLELLVDAPPAGRPGMPQAGGRSVRPRFL